jgi:hypothetical protein
MAIEANQDANRRVTDAFPRGLRDLDKRTWASRTWRIRVIGHNLTYWPQMMAGERKEKMPKQGKITWTAFKEQMCKDGCSHQKGKKGEEFWGGDNPTAYPHIHLWSDGTVALSVSQNTNPKVGDDEEIDLGALDFASSRVKDWSPALPLQAAIDHVLA